MHQRSRLTGGIVTLGLAVVVACASALAGTPSANEVYRGVTKPSDERSLPFSYPGIVKEVAVKEGQPVKAGDLLMKLDDRIDRFNLDQLNIEANSTLKVEYAEKSREQKRVRAQRLEGLFMKDAASPQELEEAKLNAELAVTQLALSVEESQTAKFKASAQRIKVELAELRSPISGIVRTINSREGEYADPQQSQRAACIVVCNNPLKIEVFLPANEAAKLSMGQELDVAYQGSDQAWRKAKITYFDPVAVPVAMNDAGTGTRRIWLEMPNPENRESGSQVQVKIPVK